MRPDDIRLSAMRVISEDEYEQHSKNMRVYGYSVVPQMMNDVVVASFKARVEDLWAANQDQKFFGRPERDSNDKMIYNLQNRAKEFIDILGNSFVERICMALLNDEYYRFLPGDLPNYILSYYNARSSGTKLDLHIDSYIPNPGRFVSAMQVAYLLDDMDESNGCTIVVPGSHRSGEYTDRELVNVEPVVAKSGDLVIWDSRLWHGTRENKVGASRWALIATFTRWWMKQAMDIPKGIPESIYRELTDRQKALMGFCSIPPVDERERINTKCGYEFLKPSLRDYR
jgi:ectoine hydroxylase-related dioxygenase (phytanoyl-CoA dioxygenase family)